MNESKLELIPNLKDRINQFKLNFSKNKLNNQNNTHFNIEINRDTLNLFYKNKKNDNNNITQTQSKSIISNIQKENTNYNYEINNFHNNENKKDINLFKNNLNNNIHNLNKSRFDDLNIQEIMNRKKIIKREKSAPKISVNELNIDFPLSEKKRENELKNNKINEYYNNTLGDFYSFNSIRTSKNRNYNPEEKLQKLLMDFNININQNNNRRIPYLDLNLNKNKYNENNMNKLYNQNNFNLLYEIRGNTNKNYIQRNNHLKSISSFDLSKDNFNKNKNRHNSKSIIKEKMDLFYQELNKETKHNFNNIQNTGNYFNYNDEYK